MSNEETQELFERVTAVVEVIVDEAVKLVKKIVDAIIEAVVPICKAISEWWLRVYKSCPNKRVFWLALHRPRERVRKKNMRRIIRWLRRGYAV